MRRLLPLVLLAAGPIPALAQEHPRLVEAVRLAREGQSDSARAVAGAVLSTTTTTAPLYPEALFTVALVASTVDEKRLHLQRVAIEYSQSAWADDARLELAQLAYAERKFDEAVRQVERLLADYPLSPVRAAGALWGSRAAFDQRNLPLACQWAMAGLGSVGADVELRNQLDFQRQRCEATLASDTIAATPPPPPAPPPAAGPAWWVQVAAFRTESQAATVRQQLERARIEATVIRDAGFWKVRAGPYGTEAEAQRALPTVRRISGGQPFVVRAR